MPPYIPNSKLDKMEYCRPELLQTPLHPSSLVCTAVFGHFKEENGGCRKTAVPLDTYHIFSSSSALLSVMNNVSLLHHLLLIILPYITILCHSPSLIIFFSLLSALTRFCSQDHLLSPPSVLYTKLFYHHPCLKSSSVTFSLLSFFMKNCEVSGNFSQLDSSSPPMLYFN